MTAATGFYETAVDRLISGSSRSILGLRGFRNEPLREYLRKELERPSGEGHSLLADPVFEAAFGWKQANCTLGDLRGRLLHAELVNALARPAQQGLTEDYGFPESRTPYAHQLQAWEALADRERCRSVLVTSGTGSGKTECFLIPILNDLAEELTQKQDGGQEGVRAIFLYPLNALIKSQKERLQAWSEPFGGRIRFCLYNGDTPEHGKADWRCEVPARRALRERPPQILVTNPTMLEYMLVRSEDQPILDKSRGRLRWIVIDEAHSYLGSQAAELTLLLRRTMHAFGCKPGEVHLVATSATIGDGSEESKSQLAGFLADLAGVSQDQVTVIAGRREQPPAIETRAEHGALAPDPTHWPQLSSEELYQVVSQEAPLVRARGALVEKPRTLSELSKLVFGRVDGGSKRKTLALIDGCTKAKDAGGQAFLPLRVHLFHRTLAGLWACANSGCQERAGTALDDSRWPFGRVFFERREHCSCGTPVFDVVQCGTCGTEYLAAEEVSEAEFDRLRPSTARGNDDDFQEELEPLDAGAGELVEDTSADIRSGVGRDRLITAAEHGMQLNVGLSPAGVLDWDGQAEASINLRIPEDEGLSCAVCRDRASDGYGIPQFRPVRVGAPFLLTSTTPTLLSMLPSWGKATEARPLNGRRLVTFTDSRQGTARTVVKAQQQVERDYVGSLLYHRLAARKDGVANKPAIEKKRAEVEGLRQVVAGNPNLQSLLASLELELETLEGPGIGRMTWADAIEELQSSEDFKRWMRSDLSELSYSQLLEQSVADLCLYREFFLRPRRQYSLEGLGLVQIAYPKLEEQQPPALFQQHKIDGREWINLLRLTVDTFVRSGSPAVQIPDDIRRWLGYPGRPSTLLHPTANKTQPSQRYWPSTQQPQAKRNRLIKLIAHTLNLSLDRDSDRRLIDELLGTMWQALIAAKVLIPVEGGYQLSLKQSAEIQTVSEAWLCPVTRRILPVSFKGVSPYLPELPASEELVRCLKVQMPEIPHPFWQGGGGGAAADAWLESDPGVATLRKLGAWNDISDRIARFSRYFRAAEHSAQLSGGELTRREREFKEGRLNLLSCSTTMEMGVDIGGLSAVAMNNVPPHPANFLQRAGRAGRRGESAALSFTLCKATPHGEAVFRDPLWPFTAQLATPRVDLRSGPIIQRHINALALATFLLEIGPDSVPKLRAGWFFEGHDEGRSAPAKQFMSWCEDAAAWPDTLGSGVKSLTRGSVLEGVSAEELIGRTERAMAEASRRWLAEIGGLLSQQAALKTRDGDSMPERAIEIRLERWRREYLLGQLASLAFLPGYGFPTGVVPLVTTTAESAVRAKSSQEGKDREDNRQRRAGFPTRDLAIAIRDYAPGTDTVLNGRVYRSSGVTLNWQLPVEADGVPEIQDLRWMWRCRQCGSNGLRLAQPEMCPSCGNSNSNSLLIQRLLQPSGFAVDWRSRPHNDISVPQYVPVREPLIVLEGAEWMVLPDSSLGRYRISSTGQLIHHSDGLHGNGYCLCLRCGRADSMAANNDRPESMRSDKRPHKRLQGGKLNDHERMCPGNDEDWAIIDNLRLGGVYSTEIFELQLRDVSGKPMQDRATAYTLGVALRRAFCALIGIEEGEVGVAVAEARDQDGSRIQSIYLFDTASGGAGYAGQVPHLLPQLIRKVKDDVLQCPSECDSACQACILTYETQHHLDDLSRHKALQYLGGAFVDAFELPTELRAFGSESCLELEPLPLAIDREWQRWKFDKIRVYLGGSPESWELLQWRFLEGLRRFRKRGIEIELVLQENVLEVLEQSQRDELYVVGAELGAALCAIGDDRMVVGNHKLISAIEIGEANTSMRWAASSLGALIPNGFWGSGDTGATYIRSALSDRPMGDLDGSAAVNLDGLRQASASGLAQLEITDEMNGPAREFGTKAWELVSQFAPELKRILRSDTPLTQLTYTDRYIRSPLSILLLERLIAGLEQCPGGLVKSSRVRISTADLGRPHPSAPKVWSHDWQDRQDRDEVVRRAFQGRFAFEWEVRPGTELPHARLLTLVWGDGIRWQLRFDQGVGYWKESNPRGNQFPFMAAPEQQLQHLRQANVSVRSVSQVYSTYWYAVQQVGSGG